MLGALLAQKDRECVLSRLAKTYGLTLNFFRIFVKCTCRQVHVVFVNPSVTAWDEAWTQWMKSTSGFVTTRHHSQSSHVPPGVRPEGNRAVCAALCILCLLNLWRGEQGHWGRPVTAALLGAEQIILAPSLWSWGTHMCLAAWAGHSI